MFLKLLPDQIMRYWDDIKLAIEYALPPHVEPNYIRMQEQFLTGDMDCWTIYTNDTIRAIVTTQIIQDTVTDTPQLLIFTLTTTEETFAESWREMYEALTKYARSKGCLRGIAYTTDTRLVDMAKRFGADCSWTLLSWEL